MLDSQNRTDLHDVLTISVGVAGGALTGAVAGLVKYISGDTAGSMPLDSLIQIIVFAASVAVALVAHRLKKARGKKADAIKETIRNRTKKMLERTYHH